MSIRSLAVILRMALIVSRSNHEGFFTAVVFSPMVSTVSARRPAYTSAGMRTQSAENRTIQRRRKNSANEEYPRGVSGTDGRFSVCDEKSTTERAEADVPVSFSV